MKNACNKYTNEDLSFTVTSFDSVIFGAIVSAHCIMLPQQTLSWPVQCLGFRQVLCPAEPVSSKQSGSHDDDDLWAISIQAAKVNLLLQVPRK